MIQLLAKLLIQDNRNTSRPSVRRAYGMLCGAVGIGLNGLLFVIKYLVGMMTGSIAVMADAFNNLSDVGSSLITLIGFKISGKRNDSEHPFGHGRVEHISGLIVAMLIMLMGFNLAQDSIEKIFQPQQVTFTAASMGILAASILVKLYMAMYNRGIGRRIDSAAMAAVATDSLSDAIATLAVLLSALVGMFTNLNIDAYAGALVSVMILRAGWCAARDTISPLLGTPPDPEFVRNVLNIVNSYDDVCGVHDLVVHDYGAGNVMLTLHVEVPADGNLMDMHDMIDTIERRLSKEMHCEAVIHMDPINTDDVAVAQVRERVEAALRERLHKDVSVHDFRMVTGPTHTNVIFDALVPMEIARPDRELRSEIRRLVMELDETWFAVVTIDRPYGDWM